MIRNLCLAAAFALCLAAPSSASAYWPYLGYGGFYGGYGWGFQQPTSYVPAPPYYAIHPPVYYGHQITARHYGASPFAWYPGMQPITYVPQPAPVAAAPPEPVMVENPYVRGARASNAKTTTTQAAMIMNVETVKIHNPFVASVGR
jgi:hypothetical protein